jgi:hypothetical protein|tara:strand:+ start:23 stop:169 length:147 start_codon:yes stop_codon:yes gene_type:complete
LFSAVQQPVLKLLLSLLLYRKRLIMGKLNGGKKPVKKTVKKASKKKEG